MTIQILPNWTKKLSIIIFVLASIAAGSYDFAKGYNTSISRDTQPMPSNWLSDFLGIQGDEILLFRTVGMIAIIVFLLAKEKIEDDYIKLLRYEAHQLALLILVVLGVVLTFYKGGIVFEMDYMVETYFYLYLLLFFYKKRID